MLIACLNTDRASRISLITYYGLEGLGNLDIDSHEEDEEGLEGNINLTGSVPSLGKFAFRQEESASWLSTDSAGSQATKSEPCVDARFSFFPTVTNSGPPSRGRHADDFGSLIDRIAFTGIQVPMGQSWRAKDILLQDLVGKAQKHIEKYGQENLPDPAVLFALSNSFRYGSNFYAFQKTHEGPFTLDVYYDSEGSPVASRLDGGFPAMQQIHATSKCAHCLGCLQVLP